MLWDKKRALPRSCRAQLTRSQVSTKQTTDRSRSWHRHVWKCWAGCSVVIQGLAWGGRVPANYGRLPNANGGQAFTCLGRHQPACEAHQEDIRGGVCQVPPPALTGHTFRAEMSSLSGDNNTYQTLSTLLVH